MGNTFGTAVGTPEIVTDEEVARYVRISTYTLQQRMREGFRRGELDLSAASHFRLGKRRYWVLGSVMETIRKG